MDEKHRFSRRAFLTGIAIAFPVAGLSFAIPAALTRQPDAAMWWSGVSQSGDTTRATLNVRIPGHSSAKILLDSTQFPVHSLRLVSAADSWKPFFDKDAPFQLLSSSEVSNREVAVFVLDIVRLTSDRAAGTVQAVCSAEDGSTLAATPLSLTPPFFTRFS